VFLQDSWRDVSNAGRLLFLCDVHLDVAAL
jgi:hypothetical protein